MAISRHVRASVSLIPSSFQPRASAGKFPRTCALLYIEERGFALVTKMEQTFKRRIVETKYRHAFSSFRRQDWTLKSGVLEMLGLHLRLERLRKKLARDKITHDPDANVRGLRNAFLAEADAINARCLRSAAGRSRVFGSSSFGRNLLTIQ